MRGPARRAAHHTEQEPRRHAQQPRRGPRRGVEEIRLPLRGLPRRCPGGLALAKQRGDEVPVGARVGEQDHGLGAEVLAEAGELVAAAEPSRIEAAQIHQHGGGPSDQLVQNTFQVFWWQKN